VTTEAALPPLVVGDRVERVRSALNGQHCDALLVTHLVNVRWLTGFTGSNALVLVVPDEVLLVTDGRYGEQAHAEVLAAGASVRIEVAAADALDRIVATLTPGVRLALEADRITWSVQRRVAAGADGVDVVPTSGLVEGLRAVKDPAELARLERAAHICDDALAEALPWLLEGPTEAEFAHALDSAMRRRGADRPSFDTIVASGPNGARPHHRPGSRVIEHGDLVVIDAGARVDGYGSDMTRTVVVGRLPDPGQARLWEAVRRAQAAGVGAVNPGAEISTVDTACRDVLDAEGLADRFVHGTGHGIGLEIHEEPFVNRRSVGILRPGQVITVEPGVYVPEVGGVRIEDSVVVTEDGCRPLTLSPKVAFVA
jgi:Xaa-Pro aminopeptidase